MKMRSILHRETGATPFDSPSISGQGLIGHAEPVGASFITKGQSDEFFLRILLTVLRVLCG
jgi:hypothetical protein